MKIFISYSRKDAGDFAEQIRKYFIGFNYDVFTDIDSISAGDVWSTTIETNISNCDIFVVIVTYGALQSINVDNEVLQAKKERKRIIPCLHKKLRHDEIKWDLNKIQGIEFDDKYELTRNLYSTILQATVNDTSKIKKLNTDTDTSKIKKLNTDTDTSKIKKLNTDTDTKDERTSKIKNSQRWKNVGSNFPRWMNRAVVIGLGVVVIILSISLLLLPGFADYVLTYFPGMVIPVDESIISTIKQLLRNLGLVLVFLGIEEIIRGLFISKKSRWNIVGLGALTLVFGSMVVGTSYLSTVITTLSVLVVMLSIGLVFAGIPHIVNGLINKENPGWVRGFSICVGALAIASSYMFYQNYLPNLPYYNNIGMTSKTSLTDTLILTDAMSIFLGIAFIIIGMEIIIVGRRMPYLVRINED